MDIDRKNSSSCSCTPKSDTISLIDLTLNRSESEISNVEGNLTLSDRFDHLMARLRVKRMEHIIKPGLYKLGNPDEDSMVFVSANYKLSFDAVRCSLTDTDCYIMVLDTKGINVWCAAGKGTFGTDELVNRILWTGLSDIVSHRTLILPQLSAPGISAHEVQRRSGFKVEYGPARASDLPEYIRTREATPDMRRVRFSLKDRIILIPVELVHVALPTFVAAIILYLAAGSLAALAAITAVIAGTVLFPALLPFIPTHDFTTKGFILGVAVAIPFSVSFFANPLMPQWATIVSSLIPLLTMPVVTAYLALNFTGCTTFTSKTGVKKEIYRYIPSMALIGGAGIVLLVLLATARFMEVI